jgi:hypothetical protein
MLLRTLNDTCKNLEYIAYMQKMSEHCDVFLGGTCSGSKWRDELIPMLGDVTYFNPMKEAHEEWTLCDQEKEDRYKEECPYLLYVLTPKMQGFYTIAEVVDSSYKKRQATIFCVLLEYEGERFGEVQKRSFKAIEKLLENNKVTVKHSLDEIAKFLKTRPRKQKSMANVIRGVLKRTRNYTQ